MAYVRTVGEGQAEGRLAKSYEAARRRAGRVFHVVQTMSLNPAVLDASIAFYVQLMHGASALTRVQRELLATVVSRANRCHY